MITELIATDEGMRKVQHLIGRVASSKLSVLLLGETGVGKEVCAEAIHRQSSRASGPFVRLNCAALPATLLESELFGHERGAFTGAQSTKPGLLEVASGGTLFLDEIGDMPRDIQAKLLRALDASEILRVGATQPRRVDFRLVAATNDDLPAAVEAGRFRRDLYFRISGMTIAIPPLRERPADLEPLARHLLKRVAEGAAPELSPAALARMRAYEWPGNVRELKNVMERAAVLCEHARIEPWHLGLEPSAAQEAASPMPPSPMPPSPMPLSPMPPSPGAPDEAPITTLDDARRLVGELRELERRRISEALRAAQGNQHAAARLLGISRGKLRRRLTSA